MNLPTFSGATSLASYLIPQGLAFLAVTIYGSFFEWTLHRNIMHRRTWIAHPFELHAMLHHKLFRHDGSYHAQNDEMKSHVTFVPRDYVLLLLVNTPVFLAAEWALQYPVLLGAWVAVLTYLAVFDILHWSFHVPNQRRMERWSWVRWLKEHHRLHHQYQNRNLNVVLPLADLVFRTRIAGPSEPGASPPAAAP
ncbi:MAG: sterol desaturase family protein [Planctomycetota bacterium]